MRPRRELARSLLVEGDLNGGGHANSPASTDTGEGFLSARPLDVAAMEEFLEVQHQGVTVRVGQDA